MTFPITRIVALALEVVDVGQLAFLEGEGDVAEIRSAISMHARQ